VVFVKDSPLYEGEPECFTHGKLFVDGHEINYVTGFSLLAPAGGPTKVTIEILCGSLTTFTRDEWEKQHGCNTPDNPSDDIGLTD